MTEHLLRRGYLDSAAALAQAFSIEPLVDLHLFKECKRIEESLRSHRVHEALAWCREHQSTLKKAKVSVHSHASFAQWADTQRADTNGQQSTIEFELRFQEYIELVRARKINEAILYSRKHLAAWSSTHMSQIRQAVVLLAFGPDTSCPPYIVSGCTPCCRIGLTRLFRQKYFDASRWDQLAISFRYTLQSMHSLAPISMLALSLHTGLAALKSPLCFAASGAIGKNHDCPICSSNLGELAQMDCVPWAHHENSLSASLPPSGCKLPPTAIATVVCKLSGKIMTEGEGREPMAFPKSGRVYSKEVLEKMAFDEGQHFKVTDPATGEICKFNKLLKVYIS